MRIVSALTALLLVACVSQHLTTRKLIGHRFILRYDSGLTVEAFYPSSNQLVWKGLEGSGAGTSGVESAAIVEVSPGVFFVSWVEKSGITVSNVLNLNSRTVTAFVTFAGANSRESASDSGTIERADSE